MITKQKMAVLLASGLNPEITSRAELASALDIALSTVGKWFAITDSQGVPRDPIVPQRHTARIAELFSIDPGRLSLPENDFEIYCYQEALARKRDAESSNATTHNSSNSSRPDTMKLWYKSPLVIGAGMCLVVGALIASLVTFFNKDTDANNITVADYRAILSQQAVETRAALALAQENDELQALLANQLRRIEFRIQNADIFVDEYQQGLNQQREALDSFSDRLPANQLDEIKNALERGDFPSASDTLSSVIDQVENDMDVAGKAAYLLGNQAVLNLQTLTAINFYRKAIELDNKNLAYRIALADIASRLGDYKNAEKTLFQLAEVAGNPELQAQFRSNPGVFVKFLSEDFLPGNENMELRSEALEELGVVRTYQGLDRQASEYFAASLAEVDQELAPSLFLKRKAYLDNRNGWLKAFEKDYQGAYNIFSSVLDLELNDPETREVKAEALMGVARSYQQLGFPEEANQAGLQALKYTQSHFHSHHYMVRLSYYILSLNYQAQGNQVEADKYFNLVLSTSGSVENQTDLMVVGSLNGLGYSQLGKGNFAEALKYFTQAEFLNSGSADVHRRVQMTTYIGQGWVFFRQGEPNLALAAFKQALSVSELISEPISRSMAMAYFGVGRIHYLRNQFHIAAQNCQQSLVFLEKTPPAERQRVPFFVYDLLRYYALNKQQSVSLPSQYSILQWVDNKDAYPLMATWLLLGDMYLSLGDYEAARYAYQRGSLVEEGYKEETPIYRAASLLGLANTAYVENNHSLANQLILEATSFSTERLGEEHQLTIAAKKAVSFLNTIPDSAGPRP